MDIVKVIIEKLKSIGVILCSRKVDQVDGKIKILHRCIFSIVPNWLRKEVLLLITGIYG